MKNKTYNLVLIFAILTIVFDFLYLIPYIIVYPIPEVSAIINRVIVICTEVLFVVGLKNKKPMLIVSKYVWNAIWGFAVILLIMFNGDKLIPSIFLDFSSIALNMALGLLILGLLKAAAEKEVSEKEITKKSPESSIDNNSQMEMLSEYKELLDMGAITQEEFDEKKKELLHS